MKRYLLNAVAALIVATAVGVFAIATKSPSAVVDDPNAPRVLVNRDRSGLALEGYDPVAYFTDGKPVQGDPQYTTRRSGALYQFASAEHKALFDADPAHYEPQYGGYCGYAASINRLSPVSPEWFQVLDGRLILQHNKKAWDLWNADLAGNIVKADANWPGLVARHGSAVRDKQLVNLDRDGLALQGYDPVAYFEDGKPVRGDAMFEAVYDGARYHFASKEHREKFENDPSHFAPAFGGYCAYAASIDKVAPVDPMVFEILDGRLLLQHSQEAYDLFNRDSAGSLASADRNWPGLVARNGR